VSLYIATLAEIKADLGISDSTDDAALTRLAEVIQGRFDALCQRVFLRTASAVEYFDGGERILLLEHWPVESVAVYLDADRAFAAASLLAATEYTLNAARGRLHYGDGSVAWPDYGRQTIKVVVTGGYVAAGSSPSAGQLAMPEGVRRALLLQVGFEWRNRRNLGQQSVSAQGANVSLAPADLLPDAKAALAPFRRY
jgi:hypothetical protein